MNRDDFNGLLASIHRLEVEVLDAGQREYCHDAGNILANFDRLAAYLDVSREKILLVYAIKHWDGIVAWANGHKSQREDVRGRIKDLRGYLALLWAMVDEDPSE